MKLKILYTIVISLLLSCATTQQQQTEKLVPICPDAPVKSTKEERVAARNALLETFNSKEQVQLLRKLLLIHLKDLNELQKAYNDYRSEYECENPVEKESEDES